METHSQAQDKLHVNNVDAIVMPIAEPLAPTKISTKGFQTAARFFKVKNARVKRALQFKPGSKRILIA